MKDAARLHHEAMALAEQALIARFAGDIDHAKMLNYQAFLLEKKAAQRLSADHAAEPSRSVLARSAASLATECGEFREAEKLLSAALAGEPPSDIAEEIRSLLEDVHFQRHLSLGGVRLFPEEFQFSMWGPVIGSGITSSREFINRAQKIETLVHRTAERKLALPYREVGRRKRDLQDKFDLYLSTGRAASYSVTFRLGGSAQAELSELSLRKVVIDELLSGIRLVEASDLTSLHALIDDEAYFNNFLGLARDIAPDGKEIKGVGFSCYREEGETRAFLQTPRRLLPVGMQQAAKLGESTGAPIKVRGILKFADSLSKAHNTIKLESEAGAVYEVEVPPGMMNDIVRPRWGEEVEVLASTMGNRLVMEMIDLPDQEA